MNKRNVSISVKMSEANWQLIAKAGSKLWPEAPVTRSSLVLALALKGAEGVLRKK
jgi:hypothetical protein